MIKRKYSRDIFCLEGDWDINLRNSRTISPALNLLEVNCGIEVLHKTCATYEELKTRLNTIVNGDQKSYGRFKLVYLAFHGNSGAIDLGVDEIHLSELSQFFENAFTDRIIHFGSCKTLSSEREVIEFLEKTNALGIAGYSKDIDFISSTVLDILFFEECQKWKSIKTIERKFKMKHNSLVNNLGFQLYY